MDSEGRLEWEVPARRKLGDYAFLLLEPTGGPLRHGLANLMGLECDKMSVEAVTVQWGKLYQTYFGFFSCYQFCLPAKFTMDSHGPSSPKIGLQGLNIGVFTSKEVMSMRCYLPAMMGIYPRRFSVSSDSFLYDMHSTMADMISDNYYGTLQKLEVIGRSDLTAQAVGNRLSLVADNLQAKDVLIINHKVNSGLHILMEGLM